MNDFLPLTVIAITVAGGLGAVARLVLGGAIQHAVRTSFPIGTVVINISGSFLLGLIMSSALASAGPAWLAIAGTGFCGGFTTFSTASVDSADLLLKRTWMRAAIYAVGTALASFGAAALGYSI